MPIPQWSPKRLHLFLLSCHDQGLLSCLRIRSKTSRILNEEQTAALERVLLSWVTFVFDLRFWNVHLLSLLAFASLSWIQQPFMCGWKKQLKVLQLYLSFHLQSLSEFPPGSTILPEIKTTHAWKWMVGIWNTIVSFGNGLYLQKGMLVSGRVWGVCFQVRYRPSWRFHGVTLWVDGSPRRTNRHDWRPQETARSVRLLLMDHFAGRKPKNICKKSVINLCA